MNTVTLVLALHNHQPVGNFGWVNRAAVESAYLPFLDVARDYPDIPFCLHICLRVGSKVEVLSVQHVNLRMIQMLTGVNLLKQAQHFQATRVLTPHQLKPTGLR